MVVLVLRAVTAALEQRLTESTEDLAVVVAAQLRRLLLLVAMVVQAVSVVAAVAAVASDKTQG